MSIKNDRPLKEADESGDDEMVLAVVTYVGGKSVYNNQAARNQGGLPAYTTFNRGVPMLTFLPDSRLGWWESHEGFDIAYDAESVAKTLVDMNYLPKQVFGPGYDQDVRDRVFDLLDLEPAMDDEGYYEQLVDIAGMDEDEAEESVQVEADTDRHDALMEYTRSTLMSVTGQFDHGFEQIQSATKTDLSGFLAEQDDDEVDGYLDAAERGEL